MRRRRKKSLLVSRRGKRVSQPLRGRGRSLVVCGPLTPAGGSQGGIPPEEEGEATLFQEKEREKRRAICFSQSPEVFPPDGRPSSSHLKRRNALYARHEPKWSVQT
ncbi:hypothetical protein HPB48_007432 [Haemaphysalis longicornis]|uniref:Uncharacterized protein n=1 Tax=Haemaphysalis longicornis TaxID=44386 RepID=A0A9J6G5J8_HAELO|nr:hypothetical protein HPB48_007432 [Haemaphysalis longicornis]